MTTVSEQTVQLFNFEGFKRAFVELDLEAWLAYYAEDAEWIEYNHLRSLDDPQRTVGKAAISKHLQMIKDSQLTLSIQDELVGPERAAFCVWVVLSSGKRIIEHTFIRYKQGLITRMVDMNYSRQADAMP